MKRVTVIIWAVLMMAMAALAARKWLMPAKVSAAGQNAVSPSFISCLGKIVPGEKVLKVTGPYSLYGPAIVREILVKRGEKVSKDALLATLHNHELANAQLGQAESEAAVAERIVVQVKAGEKAGAIAAQQSLILKYEAELKNARVVLSREEQLLADKAISPNDFDRSELSWRIAQKNFEQATNTLQSMKEVRPVDVEVAEARLDAARANVRRMKVELEQSLVRSPINGVVLEICTHPGEALDKEPLLHLGDIANLRVEAEVYVTDIAHVRPGADAVITGQGFEGEIKGTVIEVGLQVDQSSIFNPDPATFSDKRVVKAWIKPGNSERISHLINHQVNVAIAR